MELMGWTGLQPIDATNKINFSQLHQIEIDEIMIIWGMQLNQMEMEFNLSDETEQKTRSLNE